MDQAQHLDNLREGVEEAAEERENMVEPSQDRTDEQEDGE